MAGSPPAEPPKPKTRRKVAGRVEGGYKIAGKVVPWDPDIDLDRPNPTPLFPVCMHALFQSFKILSTIADARLLELQTHCSRSIEQCRKSPSLRLPLVPRPYT